MSISFLTRATVLTLLVFPVLGHAASNTTYFSCTVKEPLEGHTTKTQAVTAKFAIKGFDASARKGTLAQYPGLTDNDGAIAVSPKEKTDGTYSILSNLNSQGGDLRMASSGDIRLFGDGDGYQFTELVLWDNVDPEYAHREGYVRDYGPAYGTTPSFKQFIECLKANKPL